MDFIWIVFLIVFGLLSVIGLAWLLDWALFSDPKSGEPSEPTNQDEIQPFWEER